MEVIENFRVTLDFQVSVDPQTGEVVTHCVKKTIDKKGFAAADISPKKSKKVVDDGNPEPILILEEGKYRLNQAAVTLMNIEPDCKLDIKYKKFGKDIKPIIGKDEAFGSHGGNRVTKSFTVACRGSKHDELSKYGTEFIIEPYEEGLFILINKDADVEKELDVESKSEDVEIPMDVDLQDLIDNADVTEVSSSLFQL